MWKDNMGYYSASLSTKKGCEEGHEESRMLGQAVPALTLTSGSWPTLGVKRVPWQCTSLPPRCQQAYLAYINYLSLLSHRFKNVVQGWDPKWTAGSDY